MGGTQASTAPDDAVGEADRRALTELLAERITGRPLARLEADHRAGPSFDRRLLQEAVTAVLAAGWRPPAPALTTVEELDACRPGAVVTDGTGSRGSATPRASGARPSGSASVRASWWSGRR